MAALILALCAGTIGPRDIADQSSDECLADAVAHDAEWAVSWAQWTQTLPARTHPQDVLRDCLPAQIALGDRWGTTWCVESEAWRRAALGQAEAAARLLGGAIGLQARHGVRIGGLVPFALQREKARVRIVNMIGADGYRRAYEDGTALTTEEVYELALRDADTDDVRHARVARDQLTAQQHQVALLVGEGLRNKDIAEKMALSQRTVETHLSAIFTRLGFTSRAQLASWVSVGNTAPRP
jgi:non-specific serine/threonine protein kinase